MYGYPDKRMKLDLFRYLGQALRRARSDRALTPPDLAARIGRAPQRIWELEKDLASGRRLRDRLTLVLEICDALDLVPMLVPRSQIDVGDLSPPAADLGQTFRSSPDRPRGRHPSVFDEVFIDLGEEDEENPDG